MAREAKETRVAARRDHRVEILTFSFRSFLKFETDEIEFKTAQHSAGYVNDAYA